MDKEKKKLRVLSAEKKTVLPEVLPDPRRPAADRAPAPRARTLAHMQKLLATATAMGVSATACTKQQDPAPKTTPISPESTDAQATNEQPVDAGMMVVASASAIPSSSTSTTAPSTTAAKIPPPPLTPTGYAVVDPMPPPVHCPNIAPLVHPTVKFTPFGNGAMDVVVHFPNPTGRADYKYVKDAEATSYGATVTKTDVRADGVTVTARLPGDATSNVTVNVKGTCTKGPGTLSASISWKGAAGPSTKATITLYEH
jgi:hypothetical protein